jgi:hypothetical protein
LMRPGRAVNQPCAGHRVSATPREAPEGRPPETQCPPDVGVGGDGEPPTVSELSVMGKHHKPPWWRLSALWRRLCGRDHQVVPPRKHLNPIVDGHTGRVHLITDAAFEQGLQEHTGRYSVLCGLQINVASMVTPPGRSCESCQALGGLL